MALALGGPLLLYTLQALKDDKHDASLDAETRGTLPPTPTQPLPAEAVSVPSFVQTVQHPPLNSAPLFVTSVEWREEPWKRLWYEYAIVYASTSAQAAPTIAIRIDRRVFKLHGKLGIKTPWWHVRPIHFFANTKRTATSVLARPVGDPITDPTTGTSVIKYTYWTHVLPPSAPIPELKRALERARNNACTALNHALRPYVPNSLHMSDQQTRQGRRWADSRGLHFVHADIANVLADAMDASMVSCMLQTLLAKVLPNRLLWRNVRKSVGIRKEYFCVVHDYQKELLRLIDSLVLDSEARSKVVLSWGIAETEKPPSLLTQLLAGILSNHIFISPHAPIARLTDVASRLETLVPIIPASGQARGLCALHAKTLLARLPDKLWHSYAVAAPSMPATKKYQAWNRFTKNGLFCFSLDVAIQWFIALLLLPQDGPEGLWITCTCLYHALGLLRWTFCKRKVWRKIWKVYEGSMIQNEDEALDGSGTLSSVWSQSKASLWSTKWDSSYINIPMDLLS
ncbi:hypothetical protein FRC07_009872 [Ceratobasidium sp. 392]|nr:hypothetical protein FRC07_009872 [Ceratobasidium sp. 392]